MNTRIFTYAKGRPRIWPLVENSVDQWLTDRAWILRKTRLSGTDDGTPNFTEEKLGPYACKLYAPVGRERFGQDREVLDMSQSIAIASDIRPLESDDVLIESGGVTRRYKIHGTVNPRPAAWGQTPIYNAEVDYTAEY